MAKKEKGNGIVEITASYEKDSKRFFRYLVDTNDQGIVGTLYMSKEKDPVDEISLSFNHKD